MHLERVDPASVADEASLVLGEAWPPPALHYSAAYLTWQFGFPGAKTMGVLARDGGEPAGFVAVTPRRLRFQGAAFAGYIYSFVSVRPKYQGRGLAGELYREMMTDVRASGVPTVVFVESHGVPAQRVLFKACERLGLPLQKLGQFPNYGFLPRKNAPAPAAVAAEASIDDALGVIDACAAERTLFAAPDRAELEHALRDPRGRKLLVAREGDRPVAAATVFLSEITGPRGVDRIATVDTVFLPEPTSDRLAALLRAAGDAFAGSATAPVVSAPNLTTLPDELLKLPGLRRTGASFDGFVLHGDRHPCLGATATNVDVV